MNRRRTNWVIINTWSGRWTCLRCGDHMHLELPLPISVAAAAMKAYVRLHGGCRSPYAAIDLDGYGCTGCWLIDERRLVELVDIEPPKTIARAQLDAGKVLSRIVTVLDPATLTTFDTSVRNLQPITNEAAEGLYPLVLDI